MLLRIVMLVLVAALLMLSLLVGIIALAIRFLPWWGATLFIIALFGLLLFGLPLLVVRTAKYLMMRAGVGLFKVKGNVLRDARVQVHSVRKVEPTTRSRVHSAANHDAPVSGATDCYRMHVTITPKFGSGPFQFYDPSEFVLLPYDRKMKLRDMDDPSEAGCEVQDVQIVRVGDPPDNAPPEVVEALARLRGQMQGQSAGKASSIDDEVDLARLPDAPREKQIDLEMDSIITDCGDHDEEETIDLSVAEAQAAAEAEAEAAGSDDSREVEVNRVGPGPGDDDAETEASDEGFEGACFGQCELVLTWSVPRDSPRRVKLWYYFNEFGDIRLPG